MKTPNAIFAVFTVLLLILSTIVSVAIVSEGADSPPKTTVVQKIQKLQVPFIANKGQTDERVKFYANTFTGTVFVTEDGEVIYSIPDLKSTEPNSIVSGNHRPVEKSTQLKYADQDQRCRLNIFHHISNFLYSYNTCCRLKNPGILSVNKSQDIEEKELILKEEFVDGEIGEIKGEGKSTTKVNYFKGNNPSKWKSNISTYELADFGEVYRGIGLKLRAYGNNVEKLFFVRPEVDPGKIKIRLKGAEEIQVTNTGELEVKTRLGLVRFTKPMAYQEINGKRSEVAVEYNIHRTGARGQATSDLDLNPEASRLGSELPNSNIEIQKLPSTFHDPKTECIYGFRVASYDKTRELIIDPLLASTYLGGSEDDYGHSLAIDSDGNVYITGQTRSSNFPKVTGAYDTSYNRGDGDIFVAKLNSDLSRLLVSTYLGGSSGDVGHSLALDSSGNVYIAGWTFSLDFPTKKDAYDTSYNGDNGDGFVSKLNHDLTSLLASTYLGGSHDDYCFSLAVDSNGNAYITGSTLSLNFPTTNEAYNIFYSYGGDAFVSKLNEDLTSLLASTYLGSLDNDTGYSLATDLDGNIYVTGVTYSPYFPVSGGAYDTSYGGESDTFVSKFDEDLTNILASTYIGGSDKEGGNSLAIDQEGNIYVTGYTESRDFPTTAGSYNSSPGGSYDAFISKLNKDLTSLLASTYLGGSEEEGGNSLAVNQEGNIYVTGYTESSNFPTTTGSYNTSLSGSYDGFVSKLDKNLTTLIASTFLGGSSQDYTKSIAIDPTGIVFITGYTESSNFPVTKAAYDSSHNGSNDGIVSMFDSDLSVTTMKVGSISGYVLDTKKTPLESVRIQLTGKTTTTKLTTDSRADGFFEFTNLEADTYIITATGNGYKKSKHKVKLEEEEDKKIELKMKKK